MVASVQVGSAKAQRYPRLTLSGSVGAMRVSGMGGRRICWSLSTGGDIAFV